MKKGATVLSFNSKSPKEQMYTLCKQSDYIFACTGVVHVVDDQYINDTNNQIIVDIGYGYKDGKPVGDVQLDLVKERVAAYTPIPGGV
jgi:methylenetetrahydrofolate dehydrogenase (NADP+)/methenyltetrahydrofolate cyclohydrolase